VLRVEACRRVDDWRILRGGLLREDLDLLIAEVMRLWAVLLVGQRYQGPAATGRWDRV